MYDLFEIMLNTHKEEFSIVKFYAVFSKIESTIIWYISKSTIIAFEKQK